MRPRDCCTREVKRLLCVCGRPAGGELAYECGHNVRVFTRGVYQWDGKPRVSGSRRDYAVRLAVQNIGLLGNAAHNILA
jgi:hypothetical protein